MAGDTVETLLDAAENSIRLRGFHAVSFRDLADELGIKSSSVHYHFPQKQDLGIALVERYSKAFFEVLEKLASQADTPEAKLKAFCSVHRNALVQADRICLCGMLGAESAGLPEVLAKDVSAFFDANIKWLSDAMPSDVPAMKRVERATHIVATLQGAMMVANTMKDHGIFDRAVSDLLAA